MWIHSVPTRWNDFFAKTTSMEFEAAPCIDSLVEKPEDAQKLTDLLLSIKRKKESNLEIRLWQDPIRTNAWLQVLDTFRPVWEEFEREGGRVRIYYEYTNWNRDTGVGKKKEESTKFFDSCSTIKDTDRYYRYENEPDYDPERIYPRAIERDDDNNEEEEEKEDLESGYDISSPDLDELCRDYHAYGDFFVWGW
ncbi:hypothetical protein G6011_10389 [Alternaria panax]|uniref:Uncharacterized protein n=1 Tax=Alternaria panax TaxID=48097 RepID=A0AAD4IBS2_9PLEO|nr:hypothetical protein G6011_10389 [Alternaria panax]